ncbi:hypothetical protein HF072_04740 [Bacillus sp. RO3]|nr:hypothetical protein [Bacillus sp. RO3]
MNILHTNGYKKTEARVFILTCLIANEDRMIPVSAINRFVSRIKPSISVDTIYRTLTLFEQTGFIQTSTYKGKLHVFLKRASKKISPSFYAHPAERSHH